MQLPAKEEISPTLGVDLDEKVALENFYGKDQEAAAKLFFQDALYFEGDLKWMGSRGFAFYFPSLEPYLLSERSNGDSEIINAIVGTLELRLSWDPVSVAICKAAILRILTFIAGNWEKFQVDPRIYGDVADELCLLIEKVKLLDSMSE